VAAPIEVTGSAATAPQDVATAGVKGIEGRSPGRIAWMRLRRDKVAVAGGIVVIFLILVTIIGPHVVGSPMAVHPNLVDPALSRPLEGPLHSGISLAHPLGIDVPFGRDELARIVNGAQYSLLIGTLATVLSLAIGVTLGIVAGYFGGWVDTLISRTMDIFLAFPLLLFAIALVGVFPTNAFGVSGNVLRVWLLIFVIGFFNWPYVGRIMRGQVLSLREREFVDAARSMGARSGYILFREILPNLVGPILVYATLLIPTNILFEAALSFLGVGIIPPTPTWGEMLSDAVANYSVDPNIVVMPGLAILVTVAAFNLFGDGLRDALDPKSTR
jgi:peptide/nickel transport system permease protein/oligopeptide transport system permease protein